MIKTIVDGDSVFGINPTKISLVKCEDMMTKDGEILCVVIYFDNPDIDPVTVNEVSVGECQRIIDFLNNPDVMVYDRGC